MAPRANWKGYLRLSLVSCPVALYPATTESDKIRFNQINRDTGNRVRYRKVDEGTGEEVGSDSIVKGFEVSKGRYIEVTDEEIEAVALDSSKTIEIERFVPSTEIDPVYHMRPYYLAPDGEVAHEAFIVIRDTIAAMKKVAIARVVLTTREHVIALEPRGKGLLGITLRYPYEIRKEDQYFDEIENEKIPKDMLELASHIVDTKSGHFKPEKFEDDYENALKELLKKKRAGEKIEAPKEREPAKVINLMDALRRSVSAERAGGVRRKPARNSAQRRTAKRAGRSSARQKKAG